MTHDDYSTLRKHMLSSTSNEAIAGNPLFAELCAKLPIKVAALCLESTTVDRSELLQGMALSSQQCEELLTWVVMHYMSFKQQPSRGCVHVLMRRVPLSFLRARHAQVQGKTIGGMLMAKSVEWAMDILGELGINPLYDEAGNLCLYEFLAYAPVPIVSTLRYGVDRGFIQPEKEEVLYHLLSDHAQSSTFDFLTIFEELAALGFGLSKERAKQLFSRIGQAHRFSDKSPIVYMLLLQRMGQRYPTLLDEPFFGAGVLGTSPSVETAYATYVGLDRVWTEPSIMAKEYVQAHGPELLQALVKHAYQDGLTLIERALTRQGIAENQRARAMLQDAVLDGRSMHRDSNGQSNDWIALYSRRVHGFGFTPTELALAQCTLALLDIQAKTMHVEEHLWQHALYRLVDVSLIEKNYTSEHSTKIRDYKQSILVDRESYRYRSIMGEEKHSVTVEGVLDKMGPFLQERPPRMEKTAFFEALSQWLFEQNDPLGCLAFYLHKHLVWNVEPVAMNGGCAPKRHHLGVCALPSD